MFRMMYTYWRWVRRSRFSIQRAVKVRMAWLPAALSAGEPAGDNFPVFAAGPEKTHV